jgi:hypothetical protein
MISQTINNIKVPGHCTQTVTVYPSFKMESMYLSRIYGIKKFSTSSDDIFSSKEYYVITKWKEDFPSHSSFSYTKIANLSSKSREIGKWFKETVNDFNLYREAPDWYMEATDNASGWSKEVQARYAHIKKIQLDHTKRINKISKEAKDKMSEAESELKSKLISELRDQPELVIQLMNSSMLPFEVHVKAYEFETKDESKNYINNELLALKKRTYLDFISGSLSTDDLINVLFVK